MIKENGRWLFLGVIFALNMCFVQEALSQEDNLNPLLNFQFLSQNKSVVLEASNAEVLQPYTLSFPYGEAYLSVIVNWEHNANLKYRTIFSDSSFSNWQDLKADEHVGVNQNGKLSSLLLLGKQSLGIQFIQTTTNLFANPMVLDLTIVSDKTRTNPNDNNVARSTCNCPPVPFLNRTEWNCPWGDESPNFIPEYSELHQIVVHHQGGQAPPPYDAVVRAIWNYHVNNNGWSDIGYHWLIAPNGTVYKGRAWLNDDQNIKGAHTCGCNSNKMGICLLGDLTDVGPTLDQYHSLRDFMVWKACELSISPPSQSDGTSLINGQCDEHLLANISGHKDICGPNYTACPGNSFYPMLASLVMEVSDQYLACMGETSSVSDDIYLNSNPSLHFDINGLSISFPYGIQYLQQLSVVDLMGHVIFYEDRYDGEPINFEQLATGIYIVKFTIDGKESILKTFFNQP